MSCSMYMWRYIQTEDMKSVIEKYLNVKFINADLTSIFTFSRHTGRSNLHAQSNYLGPGKLDLLFRISARSCQINTKKTSGPHGFGCILVITVEIIVYLNSLWTQVSFLSIVQYHFKWVYNWINYKTYQPQTLSDPLTKSVKSVKCLLCTVFTHSDFSLLCWMASG